MKDKIEKILWNKAVEVPYDGLQGFKIIYAGEISNIVEEIINNVIGNINLEEKEK